MKSCHAVLGRRIVAHAWYSAVEQTHSDTMSKPSPSPPPVLCLMGPTACGKTAVAVDLVNELPFSIISVDSALVYRGLDIGSGKPGLAVLANAPHRLIDIRDPAQPYSAADFRHDALLAIREVQQEGRIPLLVGGTMLYFKVLRDGLAVMPAATPEIRQRILEEARARGWPALHERLQQVDPAAAARIHPNDPQRLQRALEVFESSGKPLSDLHRISQLEGRPTMPFTLHFMGMIPRDRKALHEQIARRFHGMLESGLVEEVRSLHARADLHAALPAMRSVGYRQVWEYLDGLSDYQTMIDKAIAATRQLAKRQLTWLRSWPELQEIPCGLSPEDVNFVKEHLKKFNADAIYW